MKVLITGHQGYIGSVMAPTLMDAGHDVSGLDTGYFAECTLVPDRLEVPAVRKDIRDVECSDLEGFDAVVHLAALSNDPIGNLNDRWTQEINFDASVRLAQLARDAGVGRFLFSSSCIMYGMSEAAVVDETAPLDPKTEYARSKVRGEKALSALADDSFSPVFLRNGTVYGVSPRMRFDTVFNDLLGRAVANRRVVVYGDGKPWRPVVHVKDLVRAFGAALVAPRENVHNQAFNTGADHLNHQVGELARIAVAAVPGCELEVLDRPGADQRTYKADFSKWARTFPDCEFEWTPERGAAELRAAFEEIGLTPEAFEDARYTRLKWLSHLLDSNAVDGELRWSGVGAAT
ncbi:MAG: SDR family oxidoreductase [Actinomycetota bacterium]|nr:SDR family oxidoreductase [Actinomycetota bacterium]